MGMCDAESGMSSAPLTGRTTERILGFDIEVDDGDWQWFLTTPWAREKDTELQDEPIKTAQKIFTKHAQAMQDPMKNITEKMTKRDFKNAVIGTLLEIFTGQHCGFKVGSQRSVDGDEMFILLELANQRSQEVICARHEMRVQLKKTAYPKDKDGKETCPTLELKDGDFDQSAEACPAWMRYMDVPFMKGKFQEFTKREVVKMIELRIQRFVIMEELQSSGVIGKCAPVHRRKEVKELWNSGWSNPFYIFRFPATYCTKIDKVRDYLGPELAFFFLFMDHATRCMLFIGVLGFFVLIRFLVFKGGEQIDQRRMVQILFAVILVTWSAWFNAAFKQKANRKSIQWGQQDIAEDSMQIRRKFIPQNRGSIREAMVRQMNWIISFAVMFETIAFVVWISKFRLDILHLKEHNPDATVLGFLSVPTADSLAAYAITANIKVVSYSWDYIAPFLTSLENYRTPSELKRATINKLFAVKALVYYYPFIYIAFAQDYLGGCGPESTACMDLLGEQLAMYLAFHVATVLGYTLLGFGMAWWQIRSEMKKTSKPYTYLQVQAKLEQYGDDTYDFMQLILLLGFVLMFAIALPHMAAAAFFLLMVEKQILAYKVMEVTQRNVPATQEGIGAWSQILQVITAMGVVSNVGIAVFQMYPMCRYSNLTKVIIFAVAENCFLLLNILIQVCIPSHDVTSMCIVERQAEYADDVVGDANLPSCRVEPTTPVVLKDTGS